MTTTSTKLPRVKRGQVWMDGDRRERGNRVLTVMKVRRTGVVLLRNQDTGKETEARIYRFNGRANGYIPVALN